MRPDSSHIGTTLTFQSRSRRIIPDTIIANKLCYRSSDNTRLCFKWLAKHHLGIPCIKCNRWYSAFVLLLISLISWLSIDLKTYVKSCSFTVCHCKMRKAYFTYFSSFPATQASFPPSSRKVISNFCSIN